MKLLVIDSTNAARIYREAGPELKAKIIETFGQPVIGKITDRIKTFEDACNELGINAQAFVRCDESADELAYRKLKVIVKALNEGWTPDWNNSTQKKYRPWFYMDSPGFRFGGSGCGYAASRSADGSRLCFKTEELCTYAAKQFLDIYKELYN